MNFGINDLKKHLGPGMGLRKNRYLIEIPVPSVSGEVLNVLCQSAGLPERDITTVDVWHKGRRYTMRGETDFRGEFEVSIVDDSEMRIRKLFDEWMRQIDNTRPDKNASLLGASFEAISPDLLNEVQAGVSLANNIKNTLTNPQRIADYAIGVLDPNSAGAAELYQTDINIWQMDRPGTDDSVDSQKVYGYKLQNAFPKQIGIVTLGDDETDALSEFSVTFAFSEFIPLQGIKKDLIKSVVGAQAFDIGTGFGNLVG